ncbi:hypothetical protein M8J76_014083 [Diaphorina citri]|nr:hypothetical protein M8J76_014083 [Diaphorina citri]
MYVPVLLFQIGLVVCAVSCVRATEQDTNVTQELKHEYHYVTRQVQTISTNINRYIDILVIVVRQGLHNIDPYPLPDVVERFDEKVWILSLSGQFLMRNGIIHNLNSISRRGNATLRYENMKLYIDTEFMFDLLMFDYTFVSEIVSIGPRGYMTGYARDLVFHSVFVFDLESEQMHLESLELMEKGDVKVQVYVSKLVDWLANPVINWLATLYEEKLLILLQDVMKRIINEHLPPKEILFLNKQV